MSAWLKMRWQRLVAWRAQNQRRLADAPAAPCCAPPPPGGTPAVKPPAPDSRPAGFLLQWPTLPTLAMFPVLVFMYRRLARHEEAEVAARSGPEYTDYRRRTPAFFPQLLAGDGKPQSGDTP